MLVIVLGTCLCAYARRRHQGSLSGTQPNQDISLKSAGHDNLASNHGNDSSEIVERAPAMSSVKVGVYGVPAPALGGHITTDQFNQPHYDDVTDVVAPIPMQYDNVHDALI
jgi:hypothetical protein